MTPTSFPEQLYNRIAQNYALAEDKQAWVANLQVIMFMFFSRLSREDQERCAAASAMILSSHQAEISEHLKFLDGIPGSIAAA